MECNDAPAQTPPSQRCHRLLQSGISASSEQASSVRTTLRYLTDIISFSADNALGGPTAALIAYHNPSITVNVVDLNTERIAAWNGNHLPIHETGLPKIVRIARDGTNEATVSGLSGMSKSSSVCLPARKPNLFFSTNVTPCISSADIIFICVNTPTKMYGVGAGASADLGALEAATRTIAKNAKSGAVIVEKSTVPCGTARIISDIVSLPEVSRPPPHCLSFGFSFVIQTETFPSWTCRVRLDGNARHDVSGGALKHTI